MIHPVRSGGQVGDAPIHPDPIPRLIRPSLRHCAGRDQKPLPVPIEQVRLALPVLGQGLQLRGRPCVNHTLQAAVHRPDRHGPRVTLPAQVPVVIGVCGVGAEPDRLGLGLGAPRRAFLAEPSGVDGGTQRGVGVDDLLDRSDGGLRTQPPRPQLGVRGAVQRHLPRLHTELAEGHPRSMVGRRVTGVQGRAQCRRLLGRRHRLHLHHDLHALNGNRRHRQNHSTQLTAIHAMTATKGGGPPRPVTSARAR